MGDFAIEAEGLVKRYGKVTALDDLSLDVKQGTVLAVHGDEIPQILRVRQIAAGLAANEDFLARAIGLFQKENPRPFLSGAAGCHHPPRSGADDNDILYHR